MKGRSNMQTDICTQEVKCSQGRENVFLVLCFCSAGLHVKGQMREACVCVCLFLYACVCVCVERGHGGCSSMPLWGVLGTDGQTVLKSMMVCQHGLLGPATSHPTLPFVCHRYIFTTPWVQMFYPSIWTQRMQFWATILIFAPYFTYITCCDCSEWTWLAGIFAKKLYIIENKINVPAFSRTPQCSICANSDAGSSAHWTFGDNASCRCLLQHTHRFELYCSSTYRSHCHDFQCHPDCRDRWRKQQGIAGMLYIYKSFRNRAVTIVFHR